MKSSDLATLPAPAIAFSDPKLPPTPEAVADMVGAEALAGISAVNRWLDHTHRHLTREWVYSATSGWYEIPLIKDRRLFYFIPKPGDFLLNVVLGDKAIASLSAAPESRHISRLLKSAKRYAEGTVFSFNARTLQADTVIALLRAKIAH